MVIFMLTMVHSKCKSFLRNHDPLQFQICSKERFNYITRSYEILKIEKYLIEHVLQSGPFSKVATFIIHQLFSISENLQKFAYFTALVLTSCPQPFLLIRVIDFIFSEPLKRLTLCVYWLVIISVSVRRFYSISKNSKTERILLRKYYHLMAVAIFVPALIFQVLWLQKQIFLSLSTFLFAFID